MVKRAFVMLKLRTILSKTYKSFLEIFDYVCDGPSAVVTEIRRNTKKRARSTRDKLSQVLQ